ncbi:ATP-dependent endonuclease [Enterovibrio calviensis]|uniref:ATP-dependent nuclease n=1 Tax=Enterovibrio calviensis TaxID=91359 RepID=UPI0037356655
MKLTNLKIINFRNFRCLSIPLNGNTVIVGENRVGKSNLIEALRLILDPSLPDAKRQLQVSDFWDGCSINSSETPTVEVHVDFDIEDSAPSILALMNDFRRPTEPSKARLSYKFRVTPPTEGASIDVGALSINDFEFITYGGDRENVRITARQRRALGFYLLPALRDAESQLGSYRYSPLRPLIEDALKNVSQEDISNVSSLLDSATDQLGNIASIQNLSKSLTENIARLAAGNNDVDAALRFSSAEPGSLFRSLSLYIDGGKRSLNDASLGSANVMLIALMLQHFEWEKRAKERQFTLLCIEEPEAHLHPQFQRSVFSKLISNDTDTALVITSHSPTIAAVTPLRSIVNLKKASDGSTVGFSLAKLPVSGSEIDDLEGYLSATRSELLFAKGVIFVEGDAEEKLIPVFADAMGINLDDLGVTVCNVVGTNFKPYVVLAEYLGLQHVCITDWDPLDGSNQPLGIERAIKLAEVKESIRSKQSMKFNRSQFDFEPHSFREWAGQNYGIFLNENTFETELVNSPCRTALLEVLEAQEFGSIRMNRIQNWKAGGPVPPEQLLAMISDVGKGRFSAQLSRSDKKLSPPNYIASAIIKITECL